MRDRLNESVAIKLTVIITAGLLTLGTVAIWYSYRVQEKQFTGLLEAGGEKLSAMAAEAVERGMLDGDRKSIREKVKLLGAQRDVIHIRITGPDGAAAFSSVEGDTGASAGSSPAPGREILRIEASGKLPAYRVLDMTTPISSSPGCLNSSCHFHKAGGQALGFVRVRLSLDAYDHMRRQRSLRLIIVGLTGIILIALLVFFAAHKLVHEPVREIIRGVKEVSIGNYSSRVMEMSRDELGTLAKNFNKMTQELHKARAELMDYANTLEFRASRKAEELEKAQMRMLQAEKMVSLGKLAAVAADELEAPVREVAENAKRLAEEMNRGETGGGELEEKRRNLESIISGAKSCMKALEELIAFSKEERESLERCSLAGIAEEAAALLRQRAGETVLRVTVEKSAGPMFVKADRSRLLQAVVALLVNASEAAKGQDGGNVAISFSRVPGFVRMVVEDDGPGMEHEVAQKVFEPFFSTKETLSSFGLGLSVVSGIITKHNGKIGLETAPGKGAKFTIDLPAADGEGAK
ncbi:MAG TPA: HAMP domain-containing sensor histidine kinase [Acidobacteriota bacterium]|nr:HAMP domain-containing sensor histidine kinase [Acidobacteriota bacterium]HNT18019.1 HAMP domain-containing sensor histidine kinase [Acidobacteriota bacterium]